MNMEKRKENLKELKELLQEDLNELINKYSNSKEQDKIVLGVLRSLLK